MFVETVLNLSDNGIFQSMSCSLKGQFVGKPLNSLGGTRRKQVLKASTLHHYYLEKTKDAECDLHHELQIVKLQATPGQVTGTVNSPSVAFNTLAE